MKESSRCNRFEEALGRPEHACLDEHLLACADCAALKLEYDALEHHLQYARKPVSPSCDWQDRVFERIDKARETREAVIPIETMRDRRRRSSTAGLAIATTAAPARDGGVHTVVHPASGGTLHAATALRIVEEVTPGRFLAAKYRVRSKVGHGRTGTVWAAVNEATSREVALKVITSRDHKDQRRPLHEVCAAAALSHKNIVNVFDVGETRAGDLFLVMELLHGETLAGLLARERRVSPMEATRITRDVARALAVAHSRSILHLNLTPADVFLHRGQDEDALPVVKVLGFGEKGCAVTSGVHAETSGAMAHLPYISPEQMRADGNIDLRADLWSVGVMLFEMVTGRRPFAARTGQALTDILGAEQPSMLDLPANSICPALTEVVARCLQHDRHRRYSSASELLEDLERVNFGPSDGVTAEVRSSERAGSSSSYALAGAVEAEKQVAPSSCMPIEAVAGSGPIPTSNAWIEDASHAAHPIDAKAMSIGGITRRRQSLIGAAGAVLGAALAAAVMLNPMWALTLRPLYVSPELKPDSSERGMSAPPPGAHTGSIEPSGESDSPRDASGGISPAPAVSTAPREVPAPLPTATARPEPMAAQGDKLYAGAPRDACSILTGFQRRLCQQKPGLPSKAHAAPPSKSCSDLTGFARRLCEQKLGIGKPKERSAPIWGF